MTAFDKSKFKNMPQTDQDKDSLTLLGELKTGIPGNFTALVAKVDELLFREIKNGDSDDFSVGGTDMTKGGIRPKHLPIVP